MNSHLKISTFAVLIGLLLGCSGKSRSVGQAPSPSPKPFELEQSEVAKLESVGCHISKISVTCDDPAIAADENKLNSLLSRQRQLERQQKTIAEVQTALSANIEAKRVAGNEIDARLLDLSMTVYGTELIKRAASNEVAISNEKMFLIVLGYKCGGTYSSSGSSQTLMETIVFPKSGNADFVKEITSNGTVDPKGQLKVGSQKHDILWNLADSTNGLVRNLQHYVETDGEFSLKKFNGSDVRLDCFKMRAAGNSTRISDRPVARRYLKCQTNSMLANPQDKTKPSPTGFGESFTVSADDENEVIEIGGQEIGKDDFTKDMVVFKLKYLIRLTSNKGLLKFEIYDQQTTKSLYEVTTSNSTPNIMLGMEDRDGNKAAVQCGEEVK